MKTLKKNGTLAVLTDKAAFFFADGQNIEKQVPLSNYKFVGWEEGADFDAATFESAHAAFVEKNNLTKAKREAQKAEREARSLAAAEARRAELASQDLDSDVTIYYADARYWYKDITDAELYFSTDEDSCREWAEDFCAGCPQGQNAEAVLFRITCRPSHLSSFNDTLGFDPSEYLYSEWLIMMLAKYEVTEDFKRSYLFETKLETLTHKHENIAGRLVVSYQHEPYMNYSHRLTGLRFGGYNETTEDLSDNPDQAFKGWDLLTDIRQADIEALTLDEAEELIRDKIASLKYGGPGKPSLRSFIQNSGIAQFLAADEESSGIFNLSFINFNVPLNTVRVNPNLSKFISDASASEEEK